MWSNRRLLTFLTGLVMLLGVVTACGNSKPDPMWPVDQKPVTNTSIFYFGDVTVYTGCWNGDRIYYAAYGSSVAVSADGCLAR